MDKVITPGTDGGVATLLLAQTRVLELIVADAPLSDILNSLARTIEDQSGGGSVAAIFLVDPSGRRLRVAARAEPSGGVHSRRRRYRDQGRLRHERRRRGARRDHDDAGYRSAPAWRDLAQVPKRHGLKAAWSMPIMSSNGRVLGTIGTYFREARTPTERERQVVELLCRTAALAIERRVAEEAARSSGARMELVVRGADVGVWYCPLPFDKLIWDERVKAHFHLPPDAEVTLDTFYERLHPDDREPTRAAITRSIEARELYDVDYRTVSPDGNEAEMDPGRRPRVLRRERAPHSVRRRHGRRHRAQRRPSTHCGGTSIRWRA